MPERQPDTQVAERELAEEAHAAGLPPDAVTVAVDAVEAGDEGVVKKRLGFGAWLAIAWLVLLVVLCATAPWLPIPDGTERVSGLSRQGLFCTAEECAKGTHPLGGDAIGRDMVSRLIYGARNSLFVGLGAIAMGLIVGGFLGLIAGYYRGALETVIVLLLDVLLSIPALVLALTLSIFLKPRVQDTFFHTPESAGRITLTLALGIISIPSLARITRANTLVWAQREFVTAARAQGAKDSRIMIREVLPNVMPAMGVIALLAIAVVIIAEASLSILGAGIELPAPTWGNIISEGVPDLTNGQAPHIVFEASAVIFLTVLALNYLGDAFRAKLDVREAGV